MKAEYRPAKSVGTVKARYDIVMVIGAKPVKWHQQIVRDNKTGRLAKVDMTEWPPKEPAVDGTTYVFKRGEEAEADHPAVLHKPYAFVAVDEK
jgi:hypothetical protein